MASLGQPPCRKEMCAEIDKQIEEHKEAIHMLKERRNALAFMSQLPVELISQIFLLAQPAGPVRKPPPTSQVCRAWRAIALGCAQIWNEIDCTKFRWAEALLALRTNATLKLFVSYGSDIRSRYGHAMTPPDSAIRKAILLALGAAVRASCLHITLPKVIKPSDLPWPAAAPALHTLAITAHADAEGPYQLPDALMTGLFPQLRHLTLRHCSFNWKVPEHFRYLRELAIIGCSTTDELIPDVVKTLAALQSMPSLETLSISLDWRGMIRLRQGSNAAVHIPSTLVDVTLPRLRVLELALQNSYLVALMSHISYPKDQLKIESALHSVSRAQAVMRCLRDYRHFKMQNGFTMDTLTMDYSWTLQIWDLSRLQDACPLQVSFGLEGLNRTLLNVVGTDLPFAAMQTVVVKEKNQLVAIYDHLDGCVTLCTSDWCIVTAHDSLNRESFIRADGTRRMPQLDTLILNRSGMPAGSMQEAIMPFFVKQLQGVCEFITALKFIDCGFRNQDKLDALRRHVTSFERSDDPEEKQRHFSEPIEVTLQKLFS